MDIRHLRSFVRIVELGSVTAAAKSMNIAQPALSQHLKQLEEAFGAKLVERRPRGVKATLAGIRLLAGARNIIDELERARLDIIDQAQRPSGKVRVGMPTSVCAVMDTPLIKACENTLPGVGLQLIEGMSGDLRDWLSEDRLDIAILFDLKHEDQFLLTPILKERLHLVGSASTDLCKEHDIAAMDLSNYPLVLPRAPHGLRLLLESWAHGNDIQLNIKFEVDAAGTVLRLVRYGHAYSILAPSSTKELSSLGAIVSRPILSPSIFRNVIMTRQRSAKFSYAVKAVEDLILREADGLIKAGEWPSVVTHAEV